jgi:hypothetical protein
LILMLFLLHKFLALDGRSVLSMQQVTQQSTHLFAYVMIFNFGPCTIFKLAKVSTRLTNDCDYFGDDGRLGSLPFGLRISLNEHASNITEPTVSDMIETVLASAANYGVLGRLKVSWKLSSIETRGRWLGVRRSLVRSDGTWAGIKVVSSHRELLFV